MTARILKCLDLCEASGLFDPARMDAARNAVRAGLLVGTLRVRGVPDGIGFSFFAHGPVVVVEVPRMAMWSADAVAFADTLTRVATLARECDRVIRGGE